AARRADSVVVGYAEQTWPQLLRDFVAGRLRPRYVQGADLSLAGLPFPRRDLLPAPRYATMNTFEATRGCIHHCEFCVVPTAWGRPVQRPVADVVADIRQKGARQLIFLDLDLVADLGYAKELFSALIPLRVTWGGLATTLIARDEELLDLAARSGCRGILIGFESLSHDSLREANKIFNTRQSYHEVVARLHDRRIAIMGCFVFGFDHDTHETFDATVELVLETKIDLPRYAILTPFPGTPLYNRLEREGRILTKDWTLYDGQHVVFQPRHLSPEELLRSTERAWKQTYSYRAIAKRLLGTRNLLHIAIPANLGYRYYAYRLHRYYTCDWQLGGGVAILGASR
ncbi:MAG: radical SAM protein, partial [Chloroflexi bacterium]|nr:radical SAM protein [Chloroflexota bacterium]